MDNLALLRAAGKGDTRAVAELLAQGADPDWTHPVAGHTALYNACANDRIEVLHALLRAGANPNLKMNYHSPLDGRRENGVVALMYARSAEAVSVLLAAGAELNSADEHGVTPLIRAAIWGKLEVVRALVEAGADRHRVTKDGSTARDMATAQIDEILSVNDGYVSEPVYHLIRKFEEIRELLDGFQ